MSFEVSADAYARFMGRYSEPLAVQFLAAAQVTGVRSVLDVGCGPGALTAQLVSRVGAPAVTALDPSEPFVEACKARFPDVDVRLGTAEALPFADDRFDATLAQLVVHFMTDPVQGLREMSRVTRRGGSIAACVWDHAGGGGPLSVFWDAVRQTDADATGEASLAGTREGQLQELALEAGWRNIEPSEISVRVGFATFEDWWQPFTLGVGPAGAYVASRSASQRDELERALASRFSAAPFEVEASAWCVRGTAS